ncbi:hypothetical protein JCM5353_003749 [Sporobolomyces roseus]
MRTSFAVASLLAVAGSVVAQSTSSIPACALTCLTSTISSSPCASTGITGLNCICTNTEFQAAYYTCQQSSCSASDLSAALSYGAGVCAQNGTPINISAVPSGASSAAASGVSSASSSLASQQSSLASSVSSQVSSASSAARTSSGSMMSSGTQAASGSTAPSSTSAPASGALKNTVSGLGFAAILAAAIIA